MALLWERNYELLEWTKAFARATLSIHQVSGHDRPCDKQSAISLSRRRNVCMIVLCGKTLFLYNSHCSPSISLCLSVCFSLVQRFNDFRSMKMNVFRLSAHTKSINSISMREHRNISLCTVSERPKRSIGNWNVRWSISAHYVSYSINCRVCERKGYSHWWWHTAK